MLDQRDFSMRVLILFILVTSLLHSCRQDNQSLEYIFVWRNRGDIDTIHMNILSQQITDSFYTIRYRVRSNQSDSTYDQEFKLPNKIDSTSDTSTHLVYEQVVPFDGKEYRILKFQYDEPNSEDEESSYFYSPEFGIILFKWGTHANSQRLTHTGDPQQDRIVFFLTETIENDSNFRRWH